MNKQAQKPPEQLSTSKPTAEEYHVASFIVHTRISNLDFVKQKIIDLEGAEIHGETPEGKIILTLESDTQIKIGVSIESLKNNTEVLNVSPVYHEYLSKQQ